MKLTKISTWAAGALAVAMIAGVAVASPMSMKQGVDASQSSGVTKVHQGCHFDCRYSERFGWHNHSNAQCRPEPCGPRRGGGYEGPRLQPRYDDGPRGGGGYRGDGHDRDNRCHYDCRFSQRDGWHNHSNANCRPEPCRGGRR